MVKQGTLETVLATVLIFIRVYFLLPITFGVDSVEFQDGWK